MLEILNQAQYGGFKVNRLVLTLVLVYVSVSGNIFVYMEGRGDEGEAGSRVAPFYNASQYVSYNLV